MSDCAGKFDSSGRIDCVGQINSPMKGLTRFLRGGARIAWRNDSLGGPSPIAARKQVMS